MGRVHRIGIGALLFALGWGLPRCPSSTCHRHFVSEVSGVCQAGGAGGTGSGARVSPAVRRCVAAVSGRGSRGANRDLLDILKQAPGFYPAEAALGDMALADRQFKDALGYFSAAVAKDERYLPAVEGRVTAALAVGDDVTTIEALEQVLTYPSA